MTTKQGTAPVNLSAEDFTAEIEQGGGVAVVDFWARWCAPCRALAPAVAQAAADLGGQARVFKVNVDEAAALGARYDIRSIPTIIVFKDGAPVERIVGLVDAGRIVEAAAAAA